MDSLLEQQRRAHEELERLEAAMVLELSEPAKTVRATSGALWRRQHPTHVPWHAFRGIDNRSTASASPRITGCSSW